MGKQPTFAPDLIRRGARQVEKVVRVIWGGSARIVSHADDIVILSRDKAAEALAWTRSVMTRLGLMLNETKTVVRDARHERFTFLGYSFGPQRRRKDGHWYLGANPSPTRGTLRFSDEAVFGSLGVLRLRHAHIGPPPCASR